MKYEIAKVKKAHMKKLAYVMVLLWMPLVSAVDGYKFLLGQEKARKERIAQDEAERRAKGIPTFKEQQKRQEARISPRFLWLLNELALEMENNPPAAKL